MNDTLLLIIVPLAALGGLAGIAYWLQRRSKKKGAIANFELPTRPPLGPTGRLLRKGWRGLIALMFISVVAYFIFGQLWMIWVTFGCIGLGLVATWFYRIVQWTGK